jgi:hypothetical protein
MNRYSVIAKEESRQRNTTRFLMDIAQAAGAGGSGVGRILELFLQ